MEQKFTKISPKFNRALFREDGAALADMFSELDETRPVGQGEGRALDMVEHVFAYVPTPTPIPGFTARWQVNLAQMECRQRNRQSLLLLVLLAAVTLVFGAVMWSQVTISIPYVPVRIFAWLSQVPELFNLLSVFNETLFSFGRGILFGILLVPVLLFAWMSAWSVSLVYLVTKKRTVLHHGLQS